MDETHDGPYAFFDAFSRRLNRSSRTEARRRHFELSSISDLAYGNQVEVTTVGHHRVAGVVGKRGTDCLLLTADDGSISVVAEQWLVELRLISPAKPRIPDLMRTQNLSLSVALERMGRTNKPITIFDTAGNRTFTNGPVLVGEENIIYTNQHQTVAHRLNSLAVISLLLPPET